MLEIRVHWKKGTPEKRDGWREGNIIGGREKNERRRRNLLLSEKEEERRKRDFRANFSCKSFNFVGLCIECNVSLNLLCR